MGGSTKISVQEIKRSLRGLAKLVCYVSVFTVLSSCSEDAGFEELEETDAFLSDPVEDVKALKIGSWQPEVEEDEVVVVADNGTQTFGITLASVGKGNISYAFKVDGVELSSGKDPFIALTGPQLTYGLQTLVIEATNGEETVSRSFSVRRNTRPEIKSISPSAGLNNISCKEQFYTFTTQAEDADDDELTFSWAFGNVILQSTLIESTSNGTSRGLVSPTCGDLHDGEATLIISDGVDRTEQRWVYSVFDPDAVAASQLGNSAITFEPASFDFGFIEAYTGSDTTLITAKNTGTIGLYLYSFEGENEHVEISANTCPTGSRPLAAGDDCSFTVEFKPRGPGLLSMNLAVNYGADEDDSTAFRSIMGITGSGVAQLNFAGLTSATPTHKAVDLVWPETTDASSFIVFEVGMSGGTEVLTYRKQVVNTSKTVAGTTVTGLLPATSYTFRVRATDVLANQDTNTTDVPFTTEPNAPPLLGVYPQQVFYSGEATVTIDVSDVNPISGPKTQPDQDSNGDTLTYECFYEFEAADPVTPNVDETTANECGDLPYDSDGQATFSASAGVFGN